MNFWQKLRIGIRAVVLTTLYFAVWIGMLMLFKKLVLAEYRIEFQGFSLALVGALVPAPSGALRWNQGNHNVMAYTMLGVPVGSYEVGRLANLGTNHWSVDVGGGYTYLNMENGREFSAVAGFTYNFENPDTDYRNGTVRKSQGHPHWRDLTKQRRVTVFHVGPETCRLASHYETKVLFPGGTGRSMV